QRVYRIGHVLNFRHVEGSRDIPLNYLNTSAAGFDSLASRSLNLRPSRPCRGSPSRSILDSASPRSKCQALRKLPFLFPKRAVYDTRCLFRYPLQTLPSSFRLTRCSPSHAPPPASSWGL